MGQVFDRPTRLRGLATRAVALGRRTDVYVGCAPRTRRHGGRDAVKRAGKQGHDGYFDVKCLDAQVSACAQYLKSGREIAVDGRLLFDEFQTQDGAYASRIYIVAERVEFLASRNTRSTGQASDEASPDQPAADSAAREDDQAA